jgi:hypothetical protein
LAIAVWSSPSRCSLLFLELLVREFDEIGPIGSGRVPISMLAGSESLLRCNCF